MHRRLAPLAFASLALLAPACLLALGASPGLALAAAFLAGAALERYRQGRRQRPLRIGETPGLWLATARDSIGVPASAVAALAVATALLVLLAPAPTRTRAPQRGARAQSPPAPVGTTQLPSPRVLRQRQGTAFVVDAARFRVARPPHPAVTLLAAQPASYRSVAVSVEGRNLSRRHFNPNHLSYRLLDGAGDLYYPQSAAGTGPESLHRTGVLGKGQTAQVDLLFSVPPSANRLTLIFEPVPDGAAQVRVALGRAG
jgi:hypothetical protein